MNSLYSHKGEKNEIVNKVYQLFLELCTFIILAKPDTKTKTVVISLNCFKLQFIYINKLIIF